MEEKQEISPEVIQDVMDRQAVRELISMMILPAFREFNYNLAVNDRIAEWENLKRLAGNAWDTVQTIQALMENVAADFQ